MGIALLEGKFAVITGAASKRGLGKATAKLFAEHGATIAILDLDEAAAREAAANLGVKHVGMACNVTDLEGIQKVMDALIAQWGQIDILVNNAGITQPLKIMEIAPKNYDAVLDVNLRGTLYCSQAIIPHMRSRKQGKIVNLSSVSAGRRHFRRPALLGGQGRHTWADEGDGPRVGSRQYPR
jgi:NAD(P)-dependent dehydrogenase (short-subunit alcohol dehydrogenase family)